MPGLVKDVDLRLESYKDMPNIQSLMSIVKPEWPFDKLQFKLFNEGTSNILLGVFLEQPLTQENCVLVRIFGYQTELYIDRDREAIYLWILNQLNFASRVFSKFTNGICYGYLPGSTVTYELLSEPKYFKMVAEKMAGLHTLPIDEFAEQHFSDVGFIFDTSPCVLNSALKFISLISDILLPKTTENCAGDGVTDNNLNEVFPTKEYLIEEVLFLRKLLSTAKSPVRFCHNDLLFGNIILSTDKGSVHFIDFEYCGYNHVCYDIANHFCEYTGMANHDFSRYPSRILQAEWVRTYLRAFKKHSNCTSTELPPIDVDEIDAWLDEIQNFTLASHLYWGIWSIVQSQRSKINFDYTKYALTRLNEYKKLKAMLLN
ncbi:ethanolamine kinase 2 [Echinococcus multilocularis]|uniref:ethanolamine kinase n=1 Tax=Echinococcus multilocularis TaxID=6211 RepID=A0A068Y326_ECHMU|nr:ethanolamine kinase 2 [Echinococcus multilocularis]